MRRIAAKVGRKFAHGPKEIDVEARILGTRLRITRTYRNYGSDVIHGDAGTNTLRFDGSDPTRRCR